jgi:hypothetical protein
VTLHSAITDAPNDSYGLIATDGKAQTVAEAARLFTRRLCASAPLADFSKKIRHANIAGRVIWWNGRCLGNAALQKKVRPALGGEPAAREPGLGTGRGGDVTGLA